MADNRSCPTVRVQHPDVEGETILINAVDYDADVHTLVEQPSPDAIAAALARYDERQAREARDLRDAIAKRHVVAPSGIHNASGRPELVRVHDVDVPGGILINRSDFDASVHQLLEEQRAAEATPAFTGERQPVETPVVIEPVVEPPVEPPAVTVTPESIAAVQAMAQQAAEAEAAAEAQKRADAERDAQAARGPRSRKQS